MRKEKTVAVCLLLCLLIFVWWTAIYRPKQSKIDFRQTFHATANMDSEHKRIALTFDDGPHPFYTKQLLDGLHEREVRASFFVLGEAAAAYPELIKRMQEEGHLIGNHTYTHIGLSSGNKEQFRKELIKTSEVLREITGEDVIYVRPPYGKWSRELEKELNMFPVMWTIDPLDWCSQDAACITRNVCAKAKDGDIILMHDQYKTTITAVLSIIDCLKEQGYDFVTVEELLLG